jgi:hypothetical protein
MAKKTRKQKERAAARRQQPLIPGGAGLASQQSSVVGTAEPEVVVGPAHPVEPQSPVELASAPSPAPAAASAAAAGGRRRVERLSTLPAAGAPRPGRVPSNAAAMFAPLESDDAAIPFDRVPYVRADLRRVAIMAGVMVVLIIIAAIVVSHVVK